MTIILNGNSLKILMVVSDIFDSRHVRGLGKPLNVYELFNVYGNTKIEFRA